MASSASAAAFLADGFGDASLRAGEADGGRDLVGVFARVREGDEGVCAVPVATTILADFFGKGRSQKSFVVSCRTL